MESKSFPSGSRQLVRLLAEKISNFDITRRYTKHLKQHYLRYGAQGWFPTTSQKHSANNKIDISGGIVFICLNLIMINY